MCIGKIKVGGNLSTGLERPRYLCGVAKNHYLGFGPFGNRGFRKSRFLSHPPFWESISRDLSISLFYRRTFKAIFEISGKISHFGVFVPGFRGGGGKKSILGKPRDGFAAESDPPPKNTPGFSLHE